MEIEIDLDYGKYWLFKCHSDFYECIYNAKSIYVRNDLIYVKYYENELIAFSGGYNLLSEWEQYKFIKEHKDIMEIMSRFE